MKFFTRIQEFFVARKFVAHHGNRFLTVYDNFGKRHNGQIIHNGLLKVVVRKPHGEIVKVSHINVVRVHRDKHRCLVQEKIAVHI